MRKLNKDEQDYVIEMGADIRKLCVVNDLETLDTLILLGVKPSQLWSFEEYWSFIEPGSGKIEDFI